MTQTLAHSIESAMSAAPDSHAIEFAAHWYTWSDLNSAMSKLEALLSQAGLGAQTPVAILLRNRPGMVAAALQVIKSDRCVVTINPFQGPDKLATDIRAQRPAVIVADPQDWSQEPIQEAAREVGSLAIQMKLDESGAAAEIVSGIQRKKDGSFQQPMPGVAVLMLSSGTTGPAKRIELPSKQLERSFASAAAYEKKRPNAGASDASKPQRTPSILSAPMVHIGGLYFMLDAVLAGRPFALLEKFNVQDYVRVLNAYRPKAVSLAPTAMRMLLDAKVDPDTFSSVKAVRGGSAPLNKELKNQFETYFKVPVLDVYGATEFAGAIAGWSLDDYKQFDKLKTGSVGRAQPGIRLRVVNIESGQPLPPNQVGVLEVCVEQINADQWTRTTDLGELDTDGFLYIRGRADDAIIRGGFKVLPREVEAVLREHPSVHEACVVGLPDERLGAVPVAAVELRATTPQPTDAELLTFLRSRLVSYQLPVQLMVVQALPRTPSLKISQHEVRNLFSSVTP